MARKPVKQRIKLPKKVQYASLAALSLLTAWVVWFALQPGQAVPTPAGLTTFTPNPAQLTPAVNPPAVVFLGDSFVEGSNRDKGVQFPDMLSSANGYRQVMLGEGGSGYVAAGKRGTTFGDRVQSTIDARPGMVVVSGGFNDKDLAAFKSAVPDTLSKLRAGLPEVPIVVLSNFVPTGEPSPDDQQKHDIIRAASAEVNAKFIDVIDIFDGTSGLIGSDNTHPTAEGHQHIANVLAPQLPLPLKG